jgi:LmbE family N-acetylglucosaminyl deacetylase
LPEPLRLLCILAHPDDESLGFGGILAKYAAEGIETSVVTATRGERGRIGAERPGPKVAGPIRERELRAAAEVLGVRELRLLGFLDGEVDQVEWAPAVARIAGHVRALRPHVVVTFPADGSYGHPDHIAISQLAGAALVAAAEPGFGADAPEPPHVVDKFYWMAWTAAAFAAYQHAIGGELLSRVDGVERRATPWPEWSLTTSIDTRANWETVWRAVQCHESQMMIYGPLGELSAADHTRLWGTQEFYRAMSLVNGGRQKETDLFAGLR